MPDFDYLLKQMNEKIDKLNDKIQDLSVKIIPLEEEREVLETSRSVLNGDYTKSNINKYKTKQTTLKEAIFNLIEESDSYFSAQEIVSILGKDYNITYIETSISQFIKNGLLIKNDQKRLKIPDSVNQQ